MLTFKHKHLGLILGNLKQTDIRKKLFQSRTVKDFNFMIEAALQIKFICLQF